MMLFSRGLATAAVLALLVLIGFTICPADEKQGAGKAVAFDIIPSGTYRNFVRNWDERQQPLLYALIRSAADYEAVFHPAPVMGPQKPFAPEATLYADKQILVLCRVVTDPDPVAVFAIEKITSSGRDLQVHFTFKGTLPDPHDRNALCLKSALQVTIPRGEYERATFVENGTEVGVLALTDGVWCVPPPGKD